MFGIYRTILALLVVFHHLMEIPVIGHYAVGGFFILSGYLMTYIMHNTYGYSLKGRLAFGSNRFLRLYPTYWAILVISLFIILFWGEETSSLFRKFMYLPASISEFFQNISFIYFDFQPTRVKPRISPPTWALTVELFYYFLICLGISKNKRRTLIWFGLGILYAIVLLVLEMPYRFRYSHLLGGSLPFSLGALMFHYKNQLSLILASWKLNRLVYPTVLGLMVYLFGWMFNNAFFFYMNYLAGALIILFLLEIRKSIVPKYLDKIIGDFSYPIYLFHWQAALFSTMILWNEPILGKGMKPLITTLLCIIICVLTSWIIKITIENPVEKIRSRIKSNKAVRTIPVPKDK